MADRADGTGIASRDTARARGCFVTSDLSFATLITRFFDRKGLQINLGRARHCEFYENEKEQQGRGSAGSVFLNPQVAPFNRQFKGGYESVLFAELYLPTHEVMEERSYF